MSTPDISISRDLVMLEIRTSSQQYLNESTVKKLGEELGWYSNFARSSLELELVFTIKRKMSLVDAFATGFEQGVVIYADYCKSLTSSEPANLVLCYEDELDLIYADEHKTAIFEMDN